MAGRKDRSTKLLVGVVVLFGVVGFCCLGGGLLVFLVPVEVTSEVAPHDTVLVPPPAAERESPQVSARNAPELPDGLGLEILETQTVGRTKRSLTVRLDRKVSEDELRDIAEVLKAKADDAYERTFIVYLLPGMQPGAGAWATTHYDPDLDVEILGLTKEQESAQLAASEELPGDRLGRWIDTTPYTGGVLVISRDGGKLLLHREFADGSEMTEELLERKHGSQTRLMVKDNDFGEYYLIEKNGDLGIYDREGLITTAREKK